MEVAIAWIVGILLSVLVAGGITFAVMSQDAEYQREEAACVEKGYIWIWNSKGVPHCLPPGTPIVVS